MKEKKRWASILAGLVVSTIAVTGCSAQSNGNSQTGGEPRQGGEYVHGIADFPPCLDIAQSPQGVIGQQLVDNLTEQNTETGEIEPWLATEVKPNDEGTSFHVKLREGVTFSNGQKLNAQAVKNTFDNAIELGKIGKSSQASAYLLGYKGTDIKSDTELDINFDRPKAGFLQALSEKPLGIIADESLQKTPEERCAEGLIGTSPWVVDKVVTNESIKLKAREDYNWGSPNAKHQGRAYLDTLTFKILPEASVRTGSLISGELNSIGGVTKNDIEVLSGHDINIESALSGGVTYGLLLNLQNPLFKDDSVRKALQKGIDRQELLDTVYSDQDKLPKSVLSSPVPGFTDLSSELAYDADAAQKLLEDDGWKKGSDGIYEKDGKRLSAKINVTSAADKTPELLQQQLKKIGFDLQIASVTSAQSSADFTAGKWEVMLSNVTRPDPDVLVTFFHPSYSIWQKDPNVYPELVSLLEQQSAELDTEKRHKIVEEIQRTVVEEGYQIPLREGASVVASQANVHDISFTRAWWVLFYDTWLSE